MPRTKRGPRRGNAHGSSRGGRGNHTNQPNYGNSGLETFFMSFNDASATRDRNAFTMQDEARNTERYQSQRKSYEKLRYNKVAFVRASENLAPTMTEETEKALAVMSLDSPTREQPEHVETDHESKIQVEEGLSPDKPGHSEAEKDPSRDEPGHVDVEDELVHSQANYEFVGEETVFVVDTIGGEPVDTGLPAPRLRSVSPVPSSSSDEVIVFKGRNHKSNGLSNQSKSCQSLNDPVEAKLHLVNTKLQEQEELLEEVLRKKHFSREIRVKSMEHEPAPPNREFRHRRGGRSKQQAEDEAMIADYIANIDPEDLEIKAAFQQREIGSLDNDVWQINKELPGEQPGETTEVSRHEWDTSDLHAFDDLSTSGEIMGNVSTILNKRIKQTGIQYLVVWEDQNADEARWVPFSILSKVDGALSLVEAFDTTRATMVGSLYDDDNSDNDSSDELDSHDDVEDSDDDDDDQDLIERRIDRMTDEQIARVLAKQEDLGLGTDEMALFDEAFAAEDEDEDDVFTQSHLTSPTRPGAKGKYIRRPRGEFPAANALPDAYDGFDVMDFERPSIQKKPKGRKGKLVFDISDEELQESLQTAWNLDRIKKKEKRQQREELRTQGLLNKKGKPDLKTKYKEGMSLNQVKEEIKNFLMGSNTTLALPPMDKADRKIVHELANAFKLKSKSIGNGNTRFPILTRSSKTSVYVEQTFEAVKARIERRFLPRMDVGSRRGGTAKRSGYRDVNSGAATYRDGDIVGGSAPELGVDNKGRAMLEKMGWSQGTALGALNNKGILQPVKHIVKTTKAGLG